MSGLRFVRHAAKQGKAVVIINRGPTRGDGLATIKLEGGAQRGLDLARRRAAAVVATAGADWRWAGDIRYSNCSLVEALKRGNSGLGL